jgi:hypothetical protein
MLTVHIWPEFAPSMQRGDYALQLRDVLLQALASVKPEVADRLAEAGVVFSAQHVHSLVKRAQFLLYSCRIGLSPSQVRSFQHFMVPTIPLLYRTFAIYRCYCVKAENFATCCPRQAASYQVPYKYHTSVISIFDSFQTESVSHLCRMN